MQKKKEIWMLQTKRADFNGLAMRLGVSPVAVRIMRNRGLLDEREMRKYLYGTLDDLYDPRQMKGMETAAGIIEKKLIEGKKIRIIGDYDIDGVCSTYILLKGFTVLPEMVRLIMRYRIGSGMATGSMNPSSVRQQRTGSIHL